MMLQHKYKQFNLVKKLIFYIALVIIKVIHSWSQNTYSLAVFLLKCNSNRISYTDYVIKYFKF